MKRILKANCLDPIHKKTRHLCELFLKRHAQSLWQCDFLSRKVMTVTGMRDLFVMVFIDVKSRQVIVSPATRKPNEVWLVYQLDQFMKTAHWRGLRVKTIMRDRDTKYSKLYRDRSKEMKLRDRTVQFRTPYQNAYVERMILTLQKECLDHYLLFDEKHLDYLLREYLAFYHQHRPHQALGNETIPKARKQLKKRINDEPLSLRNIRCEQRLGGLLKSYSRKVA